MEISPWGTVTFLAIVFLFSTTLTIGLLLLLNNLRLVRFKRPNDFIIWGIVGGILISFIFVTIKCNTSSRDTNPVVIAPSAISK